ncbi:succinate dehydrogenase / fumarate reductase iron-sulfur subunit [Bacteriovorax stolpii]|nr:succinate dehydrogenase/fumarate reductase iron-sulfur subunit [Bacteriovorax stolpii]TDP50290.1 succinate dehydrogenase / fumarate reductase iron-sulfur subunit [Bacteriovorax stolpii]
MGGNSTETMSLKLKIWRQKNSKDKGQMVDYNLDGVSPDMSFLEMLDILNNKLVREKGDQIAFDHDCREGICGMCSLMINGQAHGPQGGVTTCQLHMRKFKNGDEIVIEPWRAKAFPVVKDLMVDRSAFDQIMAAGGYVNVNTGNAPDGNSILIGHEEAELAMDAAACIGCGACVASCKNASAMLFVAAKVSQLALLPQGQVEAEHRALAMVEKMDELGFGNCTNEAECEAQCPKGIKLDNIARMNRGVVQGIFAARK